MSLKAEQYESVVKYARGYYSSYPIHAPIADAGGQFYNALSYSVKGDGVTNDTSALNALAATVSSAGGGTIYLPPGTYLIGSSGINIGSNTVLLGAGPSTIIKVPNSTNASGNIIKAESVNNVHFQNLCVDGNSSHQASGTNFGVYFGGVTNGSVSSLLVKNMTGDGIHTYNSTGIKVFNNWSTGNTYHGFEAEQCTNSLWQGNRAYSNTLHGMIINPGEVGGTGSVGLSVVNNVFDSNSQYGFAAGVANGGLGQHLSTDCVVAGNVIRNNAQYGVQLYQQNGFVVTDNNISGNGFFGIYLYESRYNQLNNNRLHNNSQSSNGAYDEIMLEGSGDGYASSGNLITNNMILIDGAVKARYAINEGTSGDGPNVISNNLVPNAGTSGRVNSIATGDTAGLMGTGLPGQYQGSGAPGFSAPQGSIYYRTDGSSTSTRLYVNTDSSTGWTAVTTAT